jgi:beta-glucanase (GH16 family)
MEPENQTYGAWPQSGEINIAQVRGNSHVTYESGRDTVASAMHWGAAFGLDQVVRTSGKVLLRRQDLGEGFHTYGIEWSEDYMFTWVDNRVVQMMYIGFGSSWGGNMFERGLFQNMWINGSA